MTDLPCGHHPLDGCAHGPDDGLNDAPTIHRWIVKTADGDGSIYACSRDCAEAAADVQQATLGECQGSDGVDAFNYCDGGCDW